MKTMKNIENYKIYNIIIYNNNYQTIAKLYTQTMFDKYINENPDTNADNIQINGFGFLGFDKIDKFFNLNN